MKTTFFSILFIAVAALGITACNKDKFPDPYVTEAFVYATYAYPNAGLGQPTIIIDTAKSSKRIQFGSPTFIAIPATQRVNLKFNNIRIKDNLGTYKIESEIVTQENVGGVWKGDSENFLFQKSSNSLDIALVLDESTSLGSDRDIVKQRAIDFIVKTAEVIPNVRFAIILFSTNIKNYPLQSAALAKATVEQQYGITSDNATKLYEAMDKGIDRLVASNAEGKALVSFTDGKSNFFSQPKYETPDYIIGRLKTVTSISSFTIGLDGKGDLQKDILKDLALNGGISKISPNISELEKVFNKIANSVTSIYTLTYDTNNARTSSNKQLRFIFKTRLY